MTSMLSRQYIINYVNALFYQFSIAGSYERFADFSRESHARLRTNRYARRDIAQLCYLFAIYYPSPPSHPLSYEK